MSRTSSITASLDSVTDNHLSSSSYASKIASLTVSWGEVNFADTYELETSTAFNDTYTQPVAESQVLGTGDTMGISVSLLQNMLVGYSYTIKVRAVDCLSRFGEWTLQNIKIEENQVVLE